MRPAANPKVPIAPLPSQGLSVTLAEDEVRAITQALLAGRASEGSVCPSEVARALAASSGASSVSWRDAMPLVHAVIDQLVAEDVVRLRWKGAALTTRNGPYRITRLD